MAHPNVIEDEATLGEVVRGMRTVAVVGMRDERHPDKAAFAIPALLHERGCEVIPINPTIQAALGVPSLPAVGALDRRVDLINVFRRSERIPALVEEILALPAERRPDVVWLQSGIRHDAAAERLAAAGMRVVQDRCLGVYVSRYRPR